MRAALYLRQSMDRDGSGLAVARQRNDCLKLCAERGWEPVEYVDNDVSASSGKARPAYTRMLADIAAGKVQAVVAWDLDRLHRRPIELEGFIDLADRHRLALATVGGDADLSTDNGRLFARIKGAVARAEVERKSARQKAANRQRAGMGKPPAGGLRAVGYEADGKTIREDEAALIREAYRELLAGGSLRSIAARWNAAGFTSARGGRWRPDSVRYALRNPRNAALAIHRREEIGPGNWPAIVPEETYRAAVALLDDPSRRTTPTTARRYLLAGLARCSCGAPVITGRTQHGQRTYRCSRARGHMSRAAEPIDDWVTRAIIGRLSAPDAADLLTSEKVDVAGLREEGMALRARLTELADLFADGTITSGQLARGTDRARTRLAVVEQELAAAGSVPVLGDLVAAADVGAVWERLDLDRRRAVIDTLVTITLLPPGRGKRTFDPSTVVIERRKP
ncbi:recombinase family protein [Geodermatophilus sp. SYSU D00758]